MGHVSVPLAGIGEMKVRAIEPLQGGHSQTVLYEPEILP